MSGDRDAHSRPTRVAILDTGLSKKYQQDAALRNSIKEYRDFVNGSTSEYQDLTGHGTNICDLLLKVYPAAHIYIGRIWGNRWRHSTEQVPDRMAKAIDHCREKWQVDIVVIPSGFNSDYERVTEDLNKARSANIIVFAAAGNHGNSLAKVEGMVSVFWSMCEGRDRQVPCMTPWKLLPKLGENDPKPDMWTWKEQARNSICETMSRALEKTY